MPIFKSKLPMAKLRHISLSGQFNVVVNSIICFSVRFCDNSKLVLENAFSGIFFRKQKGTRVFQGQEDVNAVVIIVLLSTKFCLSFLKF